MKQVEQEEAIEGEVKEKQSDKPEHCFRSSGEVPGTRELLSQEIRIVTTSRLYLAHCVQCRTYNGGTELLPCAV
jgi:hypothetical protein